MTIPSVPIFHLFLKYDTANIQKYFLNYRNELIYKTETLTDLGTYSYQRKSEERGQIDWEFGIDRYTLVFKMDATRTYYIAQETWLKIL